MPFIKPFKELGKNDAATAGGKGASLGEMTQAGIPVPSGFVVLANAFEKFITETDIDVEIDAAMHTVRHGEIHTVDAASEKIKALILGAKMPVAIAREIKVNFKLLNSKFVAVRSSATVEDSASAAWAGQLESYLNTTDKDLLVNVQKCWASLFTPRAIFYRFEKFGKETHLQKISVAVVVQKMVESEMSGIAFSVHPVTQDYNQLIIEAGLGLGEAIVSGQITPDSYVVEKVPRRILDKNVVTQTRGMFRGKAGGSEWRDVPKEHGEPPTLSDSQIFELSDLILKIESHYGFPCDIEWAFEKEKFFIVQSRPITTLQKQMLPETILTNTRFGIFPTVEDYKHDNGIVDKYLDYILANNSWYPKGIKSHLLLMAPQGIAAASGVSSVHEIGFKLGLATYHDQYMQWSYDPRDFKAIGHNLIQKNKKGSDWIEKYSNNFWKETEGLISLAADIYWNLETADLELIRSKFVAVVDQAIRAQSYGYITEVSTITNDNYWIADYVQELAPHLKSEEINLLLQPSSLSFVNKYQGELKAAKTDKQLAKVLAKYYWVKGSYFDLPRLVISDLKKERAGLKTGKHELVDKKNLFLKAKNPNELTCFVGMIESLIAIQDERKANVLRLNYALQKLTELLTKKVKGWAAEELLDLTPEEVLNLIDGKPTKDLKTSVKSRNKESVWVFVNEGYQITTESDHLEKLAKIFEKTTLSNVVKGYSASDGCVRGRVKVVLAEDDFHKIELGDILVTSMTRPEFLPIMQKASAFVTNEGGITCHAAIVAREMKKPCIIGTKFATQVLKDGDLVEVDADKGIVKIIERAGEEESLVKKFKKEIGNDELLVIRGKFIPLFLMTDWLRFYDEDFEKKEGIYPVLSIKNGDLFTHYISLNKYLEISRKAIGRYIKNPDYKDKIYDRYKAIKNRVDSFYKNYFRDKPSEESGLLKILETSEEYLHELVALTLFIDFLDSDITKKTYTENGFNLDFEKIFKVSEIYDFPSFDLKNDIEIINEANSPDYLKHIYTGYSAAPTTEEVKKKLSELDLGAIRKEIELSKIEIKKKTEVKKKLWNKLNLDEKLVADFLSWIIELRDDRKPLINKLDVLLNESVRALYKSWGIKENLSFISYAHEVSGGKEFILNKLENIEKRRGDFVNLYYGDDYVEKYQDLEEEFAESKTLEKPRGDQKSVTGTVANKGKAQGFARIIYDPRKFHSFTEGDILVTSMTRPEFIPIMKKAAAIVTNEGGIACHVAIISRELDKPCVIGTKNATEVIRDGDFVEVDANTGVVRILEKAETSGNPKWTKVFTRPHTIQRISFLWPFLTTGLPQDRKIKVNEMLVLPADENKYSYYLRENEWLPMLNQLGDYLLAQSPTDQEQEFYDTASIYLSVSKEVFESDIKKWNNQKLISWFKNYSKIYANYVMYAFSPWSVDLVLAPRLLEELTVLNPKKANRWLETISTPTRHNGMSLQQIELLKIAGRPNPSQHLKTHTKKWFWLPIYNIGDKPWTEKDFKEHLSGITNPRVELEAKEKGLTERQKNYQKVLAEIKPDQDLQRLIETVHLYTYLRDERVDKWRLALYYIEPCYEEIARRVGVKPIDAVNLLDEEIVNFLETGTLPSDIGERKKRHAILFRDGIINVFSDQKKIEDLATRELGVTAIVDKNESNGLPAYRGAVTGRARVIHRPDELGLLQKGEVLVAHHTSPEYVIAMKKAVAIVTDEGGVTSHAAIVSRELKIPCITAAQESSLTIKTGDLIEVDANNGVVKILERAGASSASQGSTISIGGDEWHLSVTRNMSAWHQFLSNEGHYHYNLDYGIPVPLRLLFLTVDGTHTHCLLIQQNNKEVADSVFAYLNSLRRISKLKSDYEKYAKRLISSLNACLKNLTLRNWQKFTEDYTRFTAGLYFTVVLGRSGADRLTEALKAKGYSDAEIPRIIATVTYPAEHTPLFASQLDLLEIAQKIQQKKLVKPTIKQALNKWLDKYGMIPVNFCDEPWTIKNTQAQLKNALTKDCASEIARLEKEHNSRVKEARTKLKEINDPKITLLAQIVAEGTYLNEFRKNVFSRVSFDYRPIFAKLAKRAGLSSWRDCFYLKPEEMEALVTGQKLKFDDIQTERRLIGAYVTRDGERIDLNGKTLIDIENYVVVQVSGVPTSTPTDSVIKGFSASWGVVRGPAKIILSSRDFDKLTPGDILVTTMTSVDFVPIMEKAAAFVTNEGGVTSHASIVAREMGKPCIIGTKIATQVLKDGDLVEVDADKGVVRILKKTG